MVISECIALLQGGGLYLYGSPTNSTISDSEFSYNIAYQDLIDQDTTISGGAIMFTCGQSAAHIAACELAISTTTFASNYAKDNGGAISWTYNKP